MKHLQLGFFLSLLALVGSNAYAQHIDWSLEYDGSTLLNEANPAWSVQSGYDGASVSGGIMTMRLGPPPITGGGSNYTLDQNTGHWDGSTSTGSTIEFRMRVEESNGERGAATLFFSTGVKYFTVNFQEDKIYASGNATPELTHELDTSVFHTYRLVLDAEHSLSVYVNGNTEAVISNYAGITYRDTQTPTNRIWLGSGTTTTNIDGITEWDYLNFTNAGAYAPIPEPSLTAAIVAALCAFYIFSRRSRRRS